MPTNDEINASIEQMNNVDSSSESVANNLSKWGDRLGTFNDQLNNSLETLDKLRSGTSVIPGMSVSNRELDNLTRTVEKAKRTLSSGASGAGSLFGKEVDNAKKYFEEIGKVDLKKLSKDMGKSFKEAFSDIADGASETEKAMKSLGAIGALGALTQGLEKVANVDLFGFKYDEVQKNLMEISGSALNIGQSFGKTFAEASGDVNAFLQSLGKTQATLYATREEILGVRKNLSKAFTALDLSMPTESVEGLREALEGAGVEVNLTNAAMLAAKGTGLDYGKVAEILADSHLQLGRSAAESVKNLAIMRNAAKDSKLEFGLVADSIFKAAKTLKFYGDQTEAISPVFKRFNETLQGTGQQGLTPEFVGDLVGALQKMTLETRSLLSLSAPGMATGAGGLLGGGLKMEQALAEGDMETVTKSLTETIKRFSGGQGLITREQAVESPALQRSYIIQRQMLEKLTGISGAGKQDMMLKLLGDLDKHGLDGNKDAAKQVKEMMSAGKETAKSTTTDMEKMRRQRDAVFVNQGKQIIKYLKSIATKTGIDEALGAVNRTAQAISGVGVPNMKTIEGAVSGAKLSIGEMGGFEEEAMKKPTRGNQIKLGEARAQNMVADAAEIYKKKISEAFQDPKNLAAFRKYEKTGIVDAGIRRSAFKESSGELQERIGELQGRKKRTVAQKTELANLLEAKEMLLRGGPRQEKYTGPKEGRAEWDQQQVDRRKQFLNLDPAIEAAQLKREQDLARMSPEQRIRAELGTIDAGGQMAVQPPQQLAPIPGIERGRSRAGINQEDVAMTKGPEAYQMYQLKKLIDSSKSSAASFMGPSLKETMNAEDITRVSRQEMERARGQNEKQEPRDIKVNSEVVVRFEGLDNVRADVTTIAEEVGRSGAKKEIATQTRTP